MTLNTTSSNNIVLPIANPAHNTVTVPAGQYVWVSSDGFTPWACFDSDYDKPLNKDFVNAIIATQHEAGQIMYVPVDEAHGRYLMIFVASDFGMNHGYDGEYLIPLDYFHELINEDNDPRNIAMYGAAIYTVTETLDMYGYFGKDDELDTDEHWDSLEERMKDDDYQFMYTADNSHFVFTRDIDPADLNLRPDRYAN